MNVYLIFCFVIFSVLLRVADYAYYSDHERMLHVIGLKKQPEKGKISFYKKYDNIFCVFPFLWSWIDIFTTGLVLTETRSVYIYLIAIVFVGARFRALQEASHTAVHFGLCQSKKWQWLLSNIFFQYPCLKPDMFYRKIIHVDKHHRYPNKLGKDPNIDRFVSIGFVPGLSTTSFYMKLVHPLTLSGLAETMNLIFKGVVLNHTKTNAIVRIFVVIAILIFFNYLFGYKIFFAIYILPLLLTYPLFSWISLLVEHRWFVDCSENDPYIKECICCRPTDYFGIAGWFIKHLIFPGTDHYHLAHSLYPFVRWNYMKAIDTELKDKCPFYSKYSSSGLLFPQVNKPSALSELRDRVTLRSRDLAPWAEELVVEDRYR